MPSYQHQWQCIHCGRKTGSISTSKQFEPPRYPSGKCPNTTSGEHVVKDLKQP